MAAIGRRMPESGKRPGTYVLEQWFEVKDPHHAIFLRALGKVPYGIYGTPRLVEVARIITLVPRELVEVIGFEKGKRPGYEALVVTQEIRDSPVRESKRFFVGAAAEFVAQRPRKKAKTDDDRLSKEDPEPYEPEPFTEAFVYATNSKGEWILNFALQSDGSVRAKISPITTRR